MRGSLEIDPTLRLSQMESIFQSPLWVTERKQLFELVELPLLAACLALYDRNVRTSESSANRNHVAERIPALIRLPFLSLSPENREIAFAWGEVPSPEDAWLKVPIEGDVFVAELSARALELAEAFQLQSLAWAGQSLEELRESFGFAIGAPGTTGEMTIEEFLERGFCYDEEDGLFFPNEELLRKHQAWRRGEIYVPEAE